MAEDLRPRAAAALWRDRAEAAVANVDELDLLTCARWSTPPATAGDEEARALATQLREALANRVEKEQSAWLAELADMLREGRTVRALRLSSRPPKAGAIIPADLSNQLVEQATAALTEDTGQERWATVLDALAYSPIRRRVIPVSLPAKLSPQLRETVARLGSRLPDIAHIFAIEPDEAAGRTTRQPRRRSGAGSGPGGAPAPAVLAARAVRAAPVARAVLVAPAVREVPEVPEAPAVAVVRAAPTAPAAPKVRARDAPGAAAAAAAASPPSPAPRPRRPRPSRRAPTPRPRHPARRPDPAANDTLAEIAEKPAPETQEPSSPADDEPTSAESSPEAVHGGPGPVAGAVVRAVLGGSGPRRRSRRPSRPRRIRPRPRSRPSRPRRIRPRPRSRPSRPRRIRPRPQVVRAVLRGAGPSSEAPRRRPRRPNRPLRRRPRRPRRPPRSEEARPEPSAEEQAPSSEASAEEASAGPRRRAVGPEAAEPEPSSEPEAPAGEPAASEPAPSDTVSDDAPATRPSEETEVHETSSESGTPVVEVGTPANGDDALSGDEAATNPA